MARAGVMVLGLVAMGAVGAGRPAVGIASELCRVRSKALVVRDVCRPREETLGPAQKVELGMGGRQGARGTHGPATGGELRVLDADGDEVGVVTATDSYYGSATATAVGRVTLPNAAGPEFIVADVDANGLSPTSLCEDVADMYRTADCSGEPLARCFGDDCVPGAGMFARPVFRQDATKACYLGDASQAETGDFFQRFRARGTTPAQTVEFCQLRGGTIVGPVVSCGLGPRVLFCGPCCRPFSNLTARPVYFFDASLVGTPPFRLAR